MKSMDKGSLSDTQKKDWLTKHGYEQSQSGFVITICVKCGEAHDYQTVCFRHEITWRDISDISQQELEEMDKKIWLLARQEIHSLQEV